MPPVVSRMRQNLAIVPAYNEAGCIADVVGDLRRHAPDFDVLVIDDGSTDRTGEVAARAGAAVVRHPFNLGIGGAVQSGYSYAAERGYSVAVQVDGDGQHDARWIEPMLGYLQAHPEVDMVTGSRFLEEDGNGYRSSRSRRLGITIFASILSWVMDQRISDPTSGFRMTGRRGIELFARDYPHDYPEVEAVLMSHSHRLRVAEIPVAMRPRLAGSSSITSRRSVYYMLKVLLAVLIGLVRARPTVEPGDEAPVAAERSI
jgi:glycosyltransferase involved in cell wall biosynthesis